MELGVRQGDVISPLLFSIFFNGLIRALKAKGVGVHMVNRILCGLWYADDTCLLAESSAELRVAMTCVDEFFRKWRLEANAKKSGVMIVRGSGGHAVPEDERPYILGGENVPVVDLYKYLGVIFNSKWNWSDHADYVYKKVDGMVNRVEYRLWKNRAVDVKTKVTAWKSIYRPIIEYGAEVWWPGAAVLDKLEILQKRVCKWSLGCGSTTVDEVVLGEVDVPPVESRLVRARLGWAGVVRCAVEGSIVSRCSRMVVRGKGNEFTWRKVMERSLREVELVDELVQLRPVSVEEERRAAVDEWKGRVKGSVRERSEREWKMRLCTKVKAAVYLDLKQKPGWEEYLGREEFERGGRLRFKFRSGSLLLNVERGRRSGVSADRRCEACDSMREETVEHFLFDCAAYVDIRQKFSDVLKAFCDEYDVQSIWEMWNGRESDRAIVVLGDCGKYMKSGGKGGADGSEENIRILSNHFLNVLWDTKKK